MRELSDLKHLKPAQNHGRVGMDLGIGKLTTLSDGHVFEAPKSLKESLWRLKRLQRKFSRAKRDGQNHKKLKVGRARLHAYIAHCKHPQERDAIADIWFYEFRRQLEYKTALRDGIASAADHFFPQARNCGCKHEQLKLSDRK